MKASSFSPYKGWIKSTFDQVSIPTFITLASSMKCDSAVKDEELEKIKDKFQLYQFINSFFTDRKEFFMYMFAEIKF